MVANKQEWSVTTHKPRQMFLAQQHRRHKIPPRRQVLTPLIPGKVFVTTSLLLLLLLVCITAVVVAAVTTIAGSGENPF
jgi:hypothetical protein